MNFTPQSPSLSHRQLQLDYHSQAELAHQVIEGVRQLETSPFVTPDIFESIEMGIPLLTSRSSAMSIRTSAAKNGASTAQISVNDPDPGLSRTYQLSPTMDTIWTVRHPSSPEMIYAAEHDDIINFLSLHLGRVAALDRLLDEATINGIDLARIISTNLPKKPRRVTTKIRYSHDSPGGPHIELHKQTKNRIANYALLVSGVYDVGQSTVTKTYLYNVDARSIGEHRRVDTRASVIMTSHHLPSNQLDFYAAQDQKKNLPISSLSQGVQVITEQAA